MYLSKITEEVSRLKGCLHELKTIRHLRQSCAISINFEAKIITSCSSLWMIWEEKRLASLWNKQAATIVFCGHQQWLLHLKPVSGAACKWCCSDRYGIAAEIKSHCSGIVQNTCHVIMSSRLWISIDAETIINKKTDYEAHFSDRSWTVETVVPVNIMLLSE